MKSSLQGEFLLSGFIFLNIILIINISCVFPGITPSRSPSTKPPLSPTPTLFTDFDHGNPFDCWTESAVKNPESMANGDLFILSAGGVNRSAEFIDLYRYHIEDKKYEKVASNLFSLHLMYEGMTLSPSRDAFWYLAKGSSGEEHVFVYR